MQAVAWGLAALVSAVTPFYWNRRFRDGAWLDRPSAARHGQRTVLRTGGVAWLSGVVFVALVFLALRAVPSPGPALAQLGLLAAAFLLGLADDRGRIGPARKLLLQAGLLIAWFVASGRLAGSDPVGLCAALATALALQLAFQIFDNLDGVVLATAFVGLLHLALLGTGGALPGVGAGASLGVLLWNRPPARVYLGNGGSQSVGLLAAGAAGTALQEASSGREFAGVILPFAWPLADLAFVVAARVAAGRRPWQGGRDHTTHRLARALGGDGPVFLLVVLAAVLLAGVVRALGWT